jgi:hypothetical protein
LFLFFCFFFFFLLRLVVSFLETIFSLTEKTENVRKCKKHSKTDGETDLNLSVFYFATLLVALQASTTGAF